MNVVHGRDHAGDLEITTEVVVVGSGAGGAVVAATLAEAGMDVVVLEEGGHVRSEEHARMRPSESLRHLWRDAGFTMAIGLGQSPMINVMMGRCIGGSSALTGGVCFRIPDAVLADWRALGLSDFTPEHLEPFYDDVETNVHVEEVPVQARSRSTQLFGEGAEKMGFSLESMRRNTNGCVGWATCNFGCPERAKMSVDISYIPRAMKAGAVVHSDCLVERVLTKGRRAVGVAGRVLNGPSGKPGGRLRVNAKRVVLACGAMFTPLVLKASGIGKRSGQVGRNLTLHPAFRIMARFDERVAGWNGALQSAYSSHFEPDGIQLNSVFVPPAILAATQPGIADDHVARAKTLEHLAIFGANLHDEAGGVVRRGLGREPIVTYRMAKKDAAAVPKALRIAGETFLAAGAKELFLPVLGLEGLTPDAFRALDLEKISPKRLECTSQHPLGTCRMGVDAKDSVVDDRGQCWDVEELFVTDGSTVPTSLGVNPQLAIMTLATRFAQRMADRRP
ncbi:MAG: GMC family oxidoreductase [Deltaproteobacteria bacterium]